MDSFSFRERLDNLYGEIQLALSNHVAEHGVVSDHNNNVVIKITNEDLQFTLDASRNSYLTEVGCHELYDNNGYSYNYSDLSYGDLCDLADDILPFE